MELFIKYGDELKKELARIEEYKLLIVQNHSSEWYEGYLSALEFATHIYEKVATK